MKVLMINSVCGIRSTGRICTDIATELEKQGHEVKIAYGRENVPEHFKKFAVRIGSDFGVKLHALTARFFDNSGFGSKSATKNFIKWINEYNPDVIHLHNIHGYYLNIEILFDYLQKSGKKVVWTLHDCWAFTGHCAYFDYAGCDKWKTYCCNCPQKESYPSSILFDNSKKNYLNKKKCFTSISNMTVVTPSQWLAGLVKKSYLGKYNIRVINNGIDTEVFKPTSGDFRKKHGIEDKKIVLGVASVWDKRKGLSDFLELSKLLDDSYRIVLVGLNKEQISGLPNNVIGMEKTNNTKELAEIYTAADVFVNPTYEDNYPTVNLEAQACGTPVITYNTGGSPESAKMFGISVPKNDIKQLVGAIQNINNIQKKEIYVDSKNTVQKYLELYGGI